MNKNMKDSGIQMQHKITYENLIEKLTTEPIIIENFEVYKNKVGYLCFSFTSKYHKYLEVGFEGSNPGKYNCASYFVTFNVYGDDEEMPEQIVQIDIIPETKEESDLLNGSFHIVPLKWQYVACCIPHTDFYPQND